MNEALVWVQLLRFERKALWFQVQCNARKIIKGADMAGKPLSTLAVLVLCCLAMSFADALDNSKWRIKLVPDDDARRAGEKEFDDVITFQALKFTSDAMAKQGFATKEYDPDVRGRGMSATFQVEVKSESNGTAKWTGSATLQSIQGQLVWTKKDKPLTFSYTGQKVQN
jgi:hypothetical protein